MIAALVTTFRAVASRLCVAVREALRPTSAAAGLARDAFRTRTELLAENALLRQQLIVARRTARRPQLTSTDRTLMVLVSAFCRTWREATLILSPNTVLRWHREGFRLLWKRKSRRRRAAPPRVAESTIALIQRMARENRLWGAERIRGELRLNRELCEPGRGAAGGGAGGEKAAESRGVAGGAGGSAGRPRRGVAAGAGDRRGREPGRAGATGGRIAGVGDQSAWKKAGIAERSEERSSCPPQAS